MKKTNIFWILLVVVLLVFGFIWLFSNNQKTAGPKNEQLIVEEYIRENIADLSPREAVLGGTFYVTSLNFIDENSVIVDYEDGHIDLRAEASFSIINNQVIIDSFRLLNGNDQLIDDNKQVLVTNYINDNISELSPEPEVLGGTFYVTNLNFIDENSVIVDYEDGHIDLKARVIYSIIDKEVVINSFQLIEEEMIEEEVNDEDLISSYIEENISELSPEPEVLGGTFYVTNLKFVNSNTIVVDYEDGHIALRAELVFTIEDGEVVINSVKLIEEEEEIVKEEPNNEDLVSNYIEENISELSPEPEVLGGAFYVTDLNFLGPGLVIVNYEDGHIALEAQATFFVENNEVTIESFKLID